MVDQNDRKVNSTSRAKARSGHLKPRKPANYDSRSHGTGKTDVKEGPVRQPDDDEISDPIEDKLRAAVRKRRWQCRNARDYIRKAPKDQQETAKGILERCQARLEDAER